MPNEESTPNSQSVAGSNTRRNWIIAAIVAAILLVSGVTLALVNHANQQHQKQVAAAAKRAAAAHKLQLRTVVQNTFSSELTGFNSLLKAEGKCTTTSCFGPLNIAVAKTYANDVNTLTVTDFPPRTQIALGEYVKVINSIKRTMIAVAAQPTFDAQKKKFNLDLVGNFPVPVAKNALFTKAFALQQAIGD